tara:strand:+ start:291 stop:482 length:192 start_codon:yes stop_codon:yes gene_type:complete
MPIVRIDENGKDIRKKNAKKAAMISISGLALASAVYYFHSPELGIFLGLFPIALSTILNLVDD